MSPNEMPVRSARDVALDLLSFVGLAVVAALATATALAAVVLLLSGRANAAQSEPGTLLLRSSDGREGVAAPLLSTDVAFRVTGMVARARVVQSFRNPTADWVEGVYVFPLPESAAVDRLTMHVGDRVIEGEIQERQAAQRTYEQARAQGQRSALLDQERPNIFTSRIANIGPRETISVTMEYQQTLRFEDGRYSMRFPMVVGPRYIPGLVRVSNPAQLGWSPDTDQVPDASRITPPVIRPGADRTNPVRLRVSLDAGVPIAWLDSPFHAIRVSSPSAERREIELATGTTPANRDFELAWIPAEAHAPQIAWFTEEKSGRHYGLLMVVPPAADRAARMPREVVFVLDTSGSMAGASIGQAREALSRALGRLSPGDRFNVIEFNSSAQALFPRAVAADASQVRRAIDWVQGLQARGGTEMAPALLLALDGSESPGRVRQVVFLTDGSVGNEEALFRLIRGRLGDTRLFTIGIGSAPNSHFMTKAAQLGRGTFTYIGRVQEVEEKMGALFARLESPVLAGLELLWPENAGAEYWPARVPDLYAGQPLVVAVALARLDGSLRVRGTREGQVWEAQVPLARNAGGAGMGTLWARGKVEGLMDSIREGAAEDTVRADVIALALEHRLVTKYTSFVAVDRTPARPADSSLKAAAVPTELPAGWEYDKVFGELPRGATDSRFALLSGTLALLFGLLMVRTTRRREAA